jgi:hypothetical protein
MRRSLLFIQPGIMVAVILYAGLLSGQELYRRLILKDGSYQSVSKYEIKGDRVLYLSAERGEWEEMPKSLVDWTATEKYDKDRSAGASIPEAAPLDKELEADRAAEQARSPQVAPGLRLPDDEGVFLLDNFKGEPQLVPVDQNTGDINKNTKNNILRAAINPISSAKQTIQLSGSHATVQAHALAPALYINYGADTGGDSTAGQSSLPDLPYDRFKIVRMQTKGGKRIVGDIKIAIYGKVTQEQKLVPTTAQKLTGGWIMVMPTESLDPGEYALVEMLGKEGLNLFVWDFGVNPNAPVNGAAWRPSTVTPVQKSDKEGELEKR